MYTNPFYVDEDSLEDYEGWGISTTGWYFVGDDNSQSGIMYYGPYYTEQQARDRMIDMWEKRDEI